MTAHAFEAAWELETMRCVASSAIASNTTSLGAGEVRALDSATRVPVLARQSRPCDSGADDFYPSSHTLGVRSCKLDT